MSAFHMKWQALFSLENNETKKSSAAAVISNLKVNACLGTVMNIGRAHYLFKWHCTVYRNCLYCFVLRVTTNNMVNSAKSDAKF